MKTLCLTLTAAFAATMFALPALAAPVYNPDHTFSADELSHLSRSADDFAIGSGSLKVQTFAFADDSDQIVEGGLKPLIIFSFQKASKTGAGGSFWGKPECFYHSSYMKKSGGAVFTLTPVLSDTCNDTTASIVFQHGKITFDGKVLGSYL